MGHKALKGKEVKEERTIENEEEMKETKIDEDTHIYQEI